MTIKVLVVFNPYGVPFLTNEHDKVFDLTRDVGLRKIMSLNQNSLKYGHLDKSKEITNCIEFILIKNGINPFDTNIEIFIDDLGILGDSLESTLGERCYERIYPEIEFFDIGSKFEGWIRN